MIKCIEKSRKFKNLTVDKDYDAIEQGDNFLVTNDAGLRAVYAKKYFRVVPIEITMEEFMNDLEIEIDGGEIIISHREEEESVDISQATHSCGVYEIQGLGNLIEFAEDILEENVIGNEVDCFRVLIRKLMEAIKAHYSLAFVTFTDNLNDANEMPYKDAMNEMAVTFAEGINRNSSNTIRLWIFN